MRYFLCSGIHRTSFTHAFAWYVMLFMYRHRPSWVALSEGPGIEPDH
jgi:hypothetical protein